MMMEEESGTDVEEEATFCRETGKLTEKGFLLVQVSARLAGSYGTLVVDIRRKGGVGGSLRSARTSVNFDANVLHNSVTMPHADNEDFIIYLENVGEVCPELSVRRVSL